MKYLSTFNESLFQAVECYQAMDNGLAKRFLEAVEQAKREIRQFRPRISCWALAEANKKTKMIRTRG
jgi:hypothetical protein